MLMLAALIVVPLFAVLHTGGWSAMLGEVREVSPHLLTWLSNADGQALTALGFLSTLGWGLGYFGMPHILTRFMGISAEEKVPHARRIAVLKAGLGDGEVVFIKLIQLFFHPIPAGLCLAAILAAIMSTADSQLLVCTSVVTEDIYKSFFRRAASQRELVVIGRAAVVAIALVATLLALDENNQVMALVSYAWAGFGAAFGPAMILSLYWPRMTARGAIAGVVTGAVTVVVWKNLQGGLFDLYELVPGFLLSTLLIVVVSLAAGERSGG